MLMDFTLANRDTVVKLVTLLTLGNAYRMYLDMNEITDIYYLISIENFSWKI